jgi:hypothetical protein
LARGAKKRLFTPFRTLRFAVGEMPLVFSHAPRLDNPCGIRDKKFNFVKPDIPAYLFFQKNQLLNNSTGLPVFRQNAD